MALFKFSFQIRFFEQFHKVTNYKLLLYLSDSPPDKDDNEIITPTHSTRQAVAIDSSMGKRRICFASDPVVTVEQNGRLMRSPTPYPKELRVLAKYAKNIQKSNFNDYAHIDGIQVRI